MSPKFKHGMLAFLCIRLVAVSITTIEDMYYFLCVFELQILPKKLEFCHLLLGFKTVVHRRWISIITIDFCNSGDITFEI